ncbi:hypothetical protein RFI_02607 [Reticulomyxa filosa]|uniref:RRM domain-containing protein n=1 Tax=Reticulomyxa filosa TaxID=46433 RepID=X6PA10_RETFI|nr:hypothetical protein RFI_02607 [Reticulomyxa filosa]|eukprot:ETO34487.1 hypothetical protein RFI_02607 [Reticulomyxa filosa]
MRAVEYFDDKAAFKSKNVSADIEGVDQRKRYHKNEINNDKLTSATAPFECDHAGFSKDRHHLDAVDKTYGFCTDAHNDMRSNKDRKRSAGGHDNDTNVSRRKVTVYLGNLKESVTKQQILNALAEIYPEWKLLTTRLNLRTGWSHAFVGTFNAQIKINVLLVYLYICRNKKHLLWIYLFVIFFCIFIQWTKLKSPGDCFYFFQFIVTLFGKLDVIAPVNKFSHVDHLLWGIFQNHSV